MYEFYTRYSDNARPNLLKSFDSMTDVDVIDNEKKIFKIKNKQWQFIESQQVLNEFAGHGGFTIRILVKEITN